MPSTADVRRTTTTPVDSVSELKAERPVPGQHRDETVDRAVTPAKRQPVSIVLGQTRWRTCPTVANFSCGVTMSIVEPNQSIGLTTISRTVASLAVSVVHTLERAVVGEDRMRTARGNAWEAVCADRARADRRAELDRLVAELAAARAAARRQQEQREHQPVG